MRSNSDLQEKLDEVIPHKAPDSVITIYDSTSTNKLYASKMTHFLYSNDKKWAQAIAAVPEIKTEKTASALLVGESNWISCLPELVDKNIKAIFFADIDPMVHQHIALMKKLLEKYDNRQDFLKNYQLELVNSTILMNPDSSLAVVQNTDIPQFFLFSEERYQACRRNLSQIEIYHTGLDLSSSEECQNFSTITSSFNYSFNVLNVTNVGDYLGKEKMNQNLSQILHSPTDNAYILFSQESADEGRQKLILQTKSWSEYLKMPLIEARFAPGKDNIPNLLTYFDSKISEMNDEIKSIKKISEKNKPLDITQMRIAKMLFQEARKNSAIAYKAMTPLSQDSSEYQELHIKWKSLIEIQTTLQTLLNPTTPSLTQAYLVNTFYYNNWRDLSEKIDNETKAEPQTPIKPKR